MRIPFKNLVDGETFLEAYDNEREEMAIAEEEIPIALDKLEDDGVLDLPIDLKNAVKIRSQLNKFSKCFGDRIKVLQVTKFREGNKHRSNYTKIFIYNKTTITALCKFLHISITKNTVDYKYEEEDYWSLITPKQIEQTTKEVLETAPKESLDAILFGRGYTPERTKLDSITLGEETVKILTKMLPNQKGYFNFKLIAPILRKCYEEITKEVSPKALFPYQFFCQRKKK